MGGSILHILTEIWIKEWSVFDGFGTTCCYCLCLNNSLLNHCMRRFSQRQDATQKVTEFIGFHENHLISILGTIVSVCNTVHSESMHGVPSIRDFWPQQVSWNVMVLDQLDLHPLFLFWKHGLVWNPEKKCDPKYRVQKIRSGLEKVGLCERLRYIFCYLKIRRGNLASSLLNCNFEWQVAKKYGSWPPKNRVGATL